MTNLIVEMLKNGVIKPSTNLFSSLIILVNKKDGTWQFCVNYRSLNSLTIKDSFLIPIVDELLDELHGSKGFPKLDLRSNHHQVLLNLYETFKIAFRTINGYFEFLVMPFGLTNVPSTFQATMSNVFRPLLHKFVLVFYKDIMIFILNCPTHLDPLRQVLKLLQQH